MQYNKPFDQTNPAAGYVNGNPATNTAGSIPCAEGLEYPQREIVAAITAAGLTPTNNDLTQLAQAIQALAGSKNTTVLDGRTIVGRNTVFFATPGSTTWTVPAGITKVFARGWGAGGGGSGNSNAAGAAGGYFQGTFTVTPGQVIPITIGAGGAGTAGAAGGNPPYGGNGGTTSFGSFASATGGTGGQAGQTPGGMGTGGVINLQGASGLDLDTTNSFAAGGSAPFGGGGASQAAGVFPGGGGGASTSSLNSSIPNAGYAGAAGCLVIEY